ncbi:uncharacterized protein LOC107619425 isoform X2 [Arachis ipaensis]|uniref:uncharacterized protein LOC107619425 isoform X2 n=1 Tax=Arachis ipaensis TaxID=130454 RepID=UPI000A2B6C66|nr:uncharacterized protein LOC107619425 isoform X2 [Arachis ipaensis]
MTRDAEAVQLLLVRSAPNYRYALFDQLLQDQKSTSFVEALNFNYGKPYDQSDKNSEGNTEHKFREQPNLLRHLHDLLLQYQHQRQHVLKRNPIFAGKTPPSWQGGLVLENNIIKSYSISKGSSILQY